MIWGRPQSNKGAEEGRSEIIFCLDMLNFQMKCQYCVVCIKREFRREVWVEDINGGVVIVEMIFKAMGDLQRCSSRTESRCTSTFGRSWRDLGTIPPWNWAVH